MKPMSWLRSSGRMIGQPKNNNMAVLVLERPRIVLAKVKQSLGFTKHRCWVLVSHGFGSKYMFSKKATKAHVPQLQTSSSKKKVCDLELHREMYCQSNLLWGPLKSQTLQLAVQFFWSHTGAQRYLNAHNGLANQYRVQKPSSNSWPILIASKR